MRSDPYQLHRAALLPFLVPENTHWPAAIDAALHRAGKQDFLQFLEHHGMAPLWHRLLQPSDTGKEAVPVSAKGTRTNFDFVASGQAGIHENKQVMDAGAPLRRWHESAISRGFLRHARPALKEAERSAAAWYLGQKHTLTLLRRSLDQADIPHLVFKGTHHREILYQNPHLRTACDIDLLVAPEDKITVIKLLQAQGFALHLSASNVSHEVTLSKGNIDIDLHWDILRPGRTRQPMTGAMIQARKDYGSHWGPSLEDTLFLMLVHPVITKYATAPQSTANRLLDMILLMENEAPDWAKVGERLEAAGLKTAAWVMLEWIRQVAGREAPEDFLRTIAPRRWRKAYLGNWISRDYSTRWRNNPVIIKAGFTLAVHDSPGDMLRAVRSLANARRASAMEMATLRKV